MNEKPIYRVRMYNGECYDIYSDYRIGRPNGIWLPSYQWRLTGAYEEGKGGALHPISLLDVLEGRVEFFHKNGKPRIAFGDIDHGTNRIQGNRPVQVWKL